MQTMVSAVSAATPIRVTRAQASAGQCTLEGDTNVGVCCGVNAGECWAVYFGR
ncbi:hypothetical protein DUNSADRAFT_8658 [Dunaliella salina]|uniref:Uncharacterized protein n=1 Tax=Dunaliella salina TaxID=3046 RepID=A0ABQ7GJ32_DUNSA|nr:hypothetical protein DUNSADRAFT_8658 [Dunaliella salina]|eukprot:KAF5834618.1 hypothetical protein DUNSADRAFT_8658 [Dunaliella salina]